jgi:hypothetical protein
VDALPEDFTRELRPDWQHQCANCGSRPVVPMSGLCGPCHFGKAATVNGGWWDDRTDALNDDALDD